MTLPSWVWEAFDVVGSAQDYGQKWDRETAKKD